MKSQDTEKDSESIRFVKESENTINEIPRRIRLDLNTPAELAIYNAMQEVEKAGADVRLTDAVILLDKARNKVSDFVDGINEPSFADFFYSRHPDPDHLFSKSCEDAWDEICKLAEEYKNLKP